MCSTYFFKEYRDEICYADTDIPFKNPPNPDPRRQGEEPQRVGNDDTNLGGDGYGNQWIYRTISEIRYPKKPGFFGWNELLCIEFDTKAGTLVYSNQRYNKIGKPR